jgi:hypothetical protein
MVRKEIVLKFYKTLAVPVLLYGAENWTLRVPQKKRIEAAEIKLLRPLAGYTLRDHKYNDDIRFELGVQSITEILNIYRTNWHDHLLRMEPYRVPLQVCFYRPTSRKMWDDQGRDGKNSFRRILEAERTSWPKP